MPDVESPHKSAAALRIALVGRPTTRYVAAGPFGPAPALGRVVERVESHGRHLEIVWDDGLVLHTGLRASGTWHLYRNGERWRRSIADLRVEIANESWVAACFAAPIVETYRQYDRSRHPRFGRLGPALADPNADIDQAIDLLYHYHDQSVPIAEALLDQHVADDIGNVFRCEALWVTGIHPFAPISALDSDDCARLIETAAALVRSHVGRANAPTDMAVYQRDGKTCERCNDTITVCKSGDHQRLLYWCAGCQQHRSPITGLVEDDTREMDPHPAAVRFLSDLPWRRIRRVG